MGGDDEVYIQWILSTPLLSNCFCKVNKRDYQNKNKKTFSTFKVMHILNMYIYIYKNLFIISHKQIY